MITFEQALDRVKFQFPEIYAMCYYNKKSLKQIPKKPKESAGNTYQGNMRFAKLMKWYIDKEIEKDESPEEEHD